MTAEHAIAQSPHRSSGSSYSLQSKRLLSVAVLLKTMLSVELEINDTEFVKTFGNASEKWSMGVAQPAPRKNAKLAELAAEKWSTGRKRAT